MRASQLTSIMFGDAFLHLIIIIIIIIIIIYYYYYYI